MSLTVIVVPAKVLPVDEEIVVLVQLPELAVDDVEVLVGEEVRDLVDVLLLVEGREHRQEVGLAQLGNRDAARPRAVHAVEYAGYHLQVGKILYWGRTPSHYVEHVQSHSVDVSGVKLCGLLQEAQARMRINDVLHQGHEVLRQQVTASP